METPIVWLLWVVVGGVTGWAASRVMRAVAEEGHFLDLILGAGAALVGGTLFTLLSGQGVSPSLNISTVMLGFAGSALALGALRFARRPLAA